MNICWMCDCVFQVMAVPRARSGAPRGNASRPSGCAITKKIARTAKTNFSPVVSNACICTYIMRIGQIRSIRDIKCQSGLLSRNANRISGTLGKSLCGHFCTLAREKELRTLYRQSDCSRGVLCPEIGKDRLLFGWKGGGSFIIAFVCLGVFFQRRPNASWVRSRVASTFLTKLIAYHHTKDATWPSTASMGRTRPDAVSIFLDSFFGLSVLYFFRNFRNLFFSSWESGTFWKKIPLCKCLYNSFMCKNFWNFYILSGVKIS